MSTLTPNVLITGELKHYEEQIVYFYRTIGEKTALNMKATNIFAYLQVYGSLTQKQLKILTNFSSSTISTTLNSFIQTGIVSREIGSNARLGIYRLKSEKVPLIYTEFSEVMKELEDLDEYIIKIQENVNLDRSQFPNHSEFIHRRLNSFRNYIEAQRRAILKIQKYSFFEENVSNLGFGNEIIKFPENLEQTVNQFLVSMAENALYSSDDPLSNLIFNYIALYGSTTQDLLVKYSGLSLSTVSRYLNHFVEIEVITALPKLYKQSRIYQLPSVSLSITQQILEADTFIFSWKPKFQEMLKSIEKMNVPHSDSFEMIKIKISQLIDQISEFEVGSNLLASARAELVRNFELHK